MKVEKLLEKDLKRELSVTIPANDIEEKINNKLVSLSKKVKMPGFRAGKVPLDIVKKKYRDEVVGEVIQDVVSTATQKAIADNKLTPAVQPSVEITEFADGKDLVYKISLEVMPEVPEVDFTKIKLKKNKADIGDAEINKLLGEVSKNYKDFTPAAEGKKAAKGDAVLIDFKGFVNDVAFPGGEGKEYRLELGSNSFIPGFEDQLIGVKKGDETKVKVKFPEAYHSADLAGKDSVFEIKVHDVLVPVEAAVDDAFAQKIGHKDLESLKTLIKGNLENDAEEMSRILLKKELFDQLEAAYKFQLPQEMVDNELNSIITQIKNSSDYEGHSHDHVHTENCDHSKEDEELKKEYGDLAKRRVMLGILVTELARKNNIQVTNEELNRALLNEAQKYPGQEKQVVEFYRKNPRAVQNLSGPIMEEKVVDHILSKVAVTDVPKGLEDLRALVLENNK